MSKWRPSPNSIYSIGDIHGNYYELELILKRILPLRKYDKIVFLGDYIDRGSNSYLVIERIIELKEKYKDQIICLSGNHEKLMLATFDETIIDNENNNIQIWLKNGGMETLISYAKSNGFSESEARTLSIDRFKLLIPEDHFSFLKNLLLYHETDDYIFVHAGLDPNKKMEDQDAEVILWDRSLFDFVVSCICKGKSFGGWDKTIIAGHNYRGPIISDKFMMIDCSFYRKIMCLELNSMEAFYSEIGNQRLVKAKVEETTKKYLSVRPSFKEYFK